MSSVSDIFRFSILGRCIYKSHEKYKISTHMMAHKLWKLSHRSRGKYIHILNRLYNKMLSNFLGPKVTSFSVRKRAEKEHLCSENKYCSFRDVILQQNHLTGPLRQFCLQSKPGKDEINSNFISVGQGRE